MKPVLLPGKGRILPFLFSLQLLSLLAVAQTRYTGTGATLLISGTSTLHDWTMKSTRADCAVTVLLNQSGQVGGLSGLNFSTPASSLKSEHTSMDNNAYKALKTDKSPVISYTMNSVAVSMDATGAIVTCKGRLTIAGATRDEDLVAVCRTNADNTITVTGSKKISMHDYQIDPPTFMLGTIKTGNDIVLTFTLTLKKA
jgi:hypothetical protein